MRSERISAVARLRTRRHRIPLYGSDGQPLGEVVDDDVTVFEGGTIVSRFRELEIELTPTAPADAAAPIVDRLRDAGAGAPDPTPKVVRALGPRATTAPDVVAAPPQHVTTIPEVIQSAIAVSVGRLLEHDAGVRLGDDSRGRAPGAGRDASSALATCGRSGPCSNRSGPRPCATS